ncbi:LxmA leader domain family RiPP [Streptomyces sp. BP-8]|uniref:LxmA leader domain family RiPP n=1 Tax=Streptomyces sirii TaxID=3127701 RepID=A0ABZ2QTW0_9ACTN
MELNEMISGYATYVDAAELDVSAESEAPATSPACFVASFMASYQVTKDMTG